MFNCHIFDDQSAKKILGGSITECRDGLADPVDARVVADDGVEGIHHDHLKAFCLFCQIYIYIYIYVYIYDYMYTLLYKCIYIYITIYIWYDIYIYREREHTWISNIASLVCFSLFCLCFHFMPRCLASYHLWTASCATLVYILSKGMILQVPRRSLLSITPRRNLMETKLCLVMGKGTVLTSDLNDFGFGSTSLYNLCSTFMLPITAWSLPSGPVGVQHTQAATLASHALLCDAAQVPHGLWRSVEAALTTRQGRLHPSDKEWFPKMRPTAG